MILLPTWRGTRWLASSLFPVGIFAALYAALVLPRFTELLPALLSPRLDTVASLLGTPEGATIAWIHFLAFDLFVGRWAYLDSRARGINAWLMAPVLALTLLFGPLGWLSYLGLRALSRRDLVVRANPVPALRRLYAVNAPLTVIGV